MDYRRLIGRITEVLRDEPRVRAAWLAGSRGRGDDDEHSDVDVWLVVEADERAGFLADWPALVDRVTPTVLRQRVGRAPVFTHVTPEWLRFDVSVGTTGEVAERSRDGLAVLFDRDGLAAGLAPPTGPTSPDPDRITALATEFLRVLGLLPVVLGRAEYVVGVSGAALLRQKVIELMVEDTTAPDRGGALKLASLLPPERLDALAALPAAVADRDSVVAAHLAYARAFLPLAREIADRTGARWPSELDDATRRQLRDRLGLDLP